MRIDIITLFPEMFASLQYGITGRAQKKRRLTLACWNPRDYTQDTRKTVDDRPYGGGPGMVMMAKPLKATIDATKAIDGPATVIHLTPQGRPLNQAGVEALATRERLILLAGRYEGIDERLIETEIDEEWSIGDYVLSGGELAAMVMVDAIARLLPGVLGDEQSAQQDSFTTGLLDCPHYTRPEVFAGHEVPKVLLSGNHQAIARWRLQQALGRTQQRRPDLLAQRTLTQQEQTLLDELMQDS